MKKKNKGTNIDPCGTPIVILLGFDITPFYLSENHLITSSQSGFRPIHSCETAFNCLIDRWLRNIDQGKLTGVYIRIFQTFRRIVYK
jgi:hypothetical protein